MDYAFLVVGVVVLAKAADQFVIGSVRVANVLRVSTIVIGAVVMGFGTSAPEMVVSGIAAGGGELDVGVGNIVGSNIANLTLVLGVAGAITAVAIPASVLRREAPMSMASLVVFAVLVQDGLLFWEGLVLAGAMAAAIAIVLLGARSGEQDPGGELGELLDEATNIAEDNGLSGGFVGLTLVAVGTSLPELVTTVLAARKGQTDLIVGNLLGSNLFNSFAVGGVTALLGNGPLDDPDLDGLPILMMVGIGFIAWAFMAQGRKISRWEGIVLLILAGACVPFLPR